MATNNLVTENYLNSNAYPRPGITPGTDNIRMLDCDQVTSRYYVSVTGVSTTGVRLPSQNQIVIQNTTPPIVYTHNLMSSITATSAVATAFIENYPSVGVLAHGFCYSSATSTPTLSNSVVAGGTISATGNIWQYTAYISGLVTYRHYFVRAYVTTIVGTYYGDVVTHTLVGSVHVSHTFVSSSLEFMPSAIALGIFLEGGRVFHIFNSGDSGYDPNIQHAWILSSEVGNGGFIDMTQPDAITAALASTLGLKSDWELPTVDRALEILALKAAQPELFPYPNATYWTSTDGSSGNAYAYSLLNLNTFQLNKSTLAYAHGYRKF